MQNYIGLHKDDLMLEQEKLVNQLDFHSRADRMSNGELQRWNKCKYELKQVRKELQRRKEAGENVNNKLFLLQRRWSR